jgi:hypothetical protein
MLVGNDDSSSDLIFKKWRAYVKWEMCLVTYKGEVERALSAVNDSIQ